MGYVDIHSHVLPYMDDGSQDMETTMDMLRIAEAEGISDIIVTPHYKSGRFKGDSAQMHKLLESVRERIYEAEMQINLYPGNEIFYRSELEERLETGELSTMNRSSYVLVEFSPMEDFLYIRNAMEDIFSMGYIPILAHVERYQCMHMKQERVRELKNKGCEIQVNAASVTGETGLMCKRFVHRLLKEKLVDYIGTDAHNTSGRKPAMKKCAEVLQKKYGREYADALLGENARERLM